MAKYKIPFVIIKDGDICYESSVDVTFTKKDIAELEQFIIDHNYSYEFVDVPGHIYDKCNEKAFDRALTEFKDLAWPDRGYEMALGDIIPVSLLEVLSPETIEKVGENIPPEYFDEEMDDIEDGDEENEAEVEFPEPTKENTLYLVIKQQYFDLIVDGVKKEEYRDIQPRTYKKVLYVGKNGEPFYNMEVFPEEKFAEYDQAFDLNIYNDGVCPLIPKPDLFYLDLAVGYHKERDTAKVQVVDITFEPQTDVDGEVYRFDADENGDIVRSPDGKYCFWTAVLHLGEVVEKNIIEKNTK